MEHLDVLIVGAGLSGIGAGHYIQSECPWASYAIFEARDAIGGTWDLFRYPGIRSDSDMYTLGYSFRPWTGEKAIADGSSILEYIKDTAAVEGIDQHIRFHHRIVRAEWSTSEGRWLITAGMAGRSRLRRQARRGDRKRRDRGDARALDGRDRRARHHAATLAELHHDDAGEEPDRRAAQATAR